MNAVDSFSARQGLQGCYEGTADRPSAHVERNIHVALQETRSISEECYANLLELQERLAPVLKPPTTTAASENEKSPNCGSPLHGSIEELFNRFMQFSRVIGGILDRLDV